MFEFKPMITGSPVKIFSDGMNQRHSILCQRLQLLQGYHKLPFYMLRRMSGFEFTPMEKNIQ